MDKQDQLKRTLISTALAFSLSILSWCIQNIKSEEKLVKGNEQAKEQSKEVMSRILIRN